MQLRQQNGSRQDDGDHYRRRRSDSSNRSHGRGPPRRGDAARPSYAADGGGTHNGRNNNGNSSNSNGNSGSSNQTTNADGVFQPLACAADNECCAAFADCAAFTDLPRLRSNAATANEVFIFPLEFDGSLLSPTTGYDSDADSVPSLIVDYDSDSDDEDDASSTASHDSMPSLIDDSDTDSMDGDSDDEDDAASTASDDSMPSLIDDSDTDSMDGNSNDDDDAPPTLAANCATGDNAFSELGSDTTSQDADGDYELADSDELNAPIWSSQLDQDISEWIHATNLGSPLPKIISAGFGDLAVSDFANPDVWTLCYSLPADESPLALDAPHIDPPLCQGSTDAHTDTGVATWEPICAATTPPSTLVCGLDTMAHNHFVGDRSLLINTRPVPPERYGSTTTADGSSHRPSCIGTLPVVFTDDAGNRVYLNIHDVLAMDHWPNSRILLSIGQWEQLTDSNGQPIFRKTDNCLIFHATDGRTQHRRTYKLPYSRGRIHTITPHAIGPDAVPRTQQEVDVAAAATPARPFRINSETAHQRFGFVNPNYIKATVEQGRGLNLTDNPARLQTPVTEAAIHGMSRQQPRVSTTSDPANTTRRNWSGQKIGTIHMDTHGPYIEAVNRAVYFSSFTTNNRQTYVYFHRDITENALMNAVKAARLELGTPTEIRMDRNQTLIKNDPLVLTRFQQFCLDEGIALKISPPGHQEMDGVSEKSGGRDIYEHATALLHHSGLSKRFWPFAVQHFVDVFNCVPRPTTENTSPYFLHYGITPYIGHFRTFGCPAWVHKDKAARGATAAFSSRVDRCIHLGSARDSPPGTYLLYKFATRQLVIARDVIFDESFRLVTRTASGWKYQDARMDNEFDTTLGAPTSLEFVHTDDVIAREGNRPAPTTSPTSSSASSTSSTSPTTSSEQPTPPTASTTPPEQPTPPTTDALETTADADDTTTAARNRRPPQTFQFQNVPDSQWSDSQTTTATPSTPSDTTVQTVCSTLPKQPNPPTMTAHLTPEWGKCDKDFQEFAAEHGLEPAQTSYRKEMNGVVDAGVLSVPVELPPGQKALTTRIVVKEKTDGTLKSRFCVRGCHQQHGVNYDHEATYAPVADKVCIRILFAIAAATCAHIHTLDVNLAFLYGDLQDDVYISPPSGFTFGTSASGKRLVCKLLKSLYGLRQAPAVWRGVLHAFFLVLGFTSCDGDPCVYFRRADAIFTLIAVHVDDMLIVCNDLRTLATFKDAVKARFKVKDQGPIHGREFLGIEVDHDQPRGIVSLYCDRFLQDTLAKLGIKIGDLYPASTPIAPSDKTIPPQPASTMENPPSWDLRKLSGCLTYATSICRPDLAVSASLMSSTDWNNITTQNVEHGDRSLRYIVGTLQKYPKLGLRYNRDVFDNDQDALTLLCYADSDHAGDQKTCRSRSGHAIYLANSLVYWLSKFQATIALSSTSAEIASLSDLCRQLVWISGILTQLGFPQRLVPIYEDNRPAIAVAYRTNLTQRNRHMRIRDLWVRELCTSDLCRVFYCNTKANIADFFTKVFPTRMFKEFVPKFSGYTNERHVPPLVAE